MRAMPLEEAARLLDISRRTLERARRRGTLPDRLTLEELPRTEVFGPILHVCTYRRAELPKVLDWLRSTGFGLTLGIHSRIQSFVDDVVAATRVGNTYVNRSMIGAVVGVQPFGGEGLSGTGPKAGGPHYMLRFATERTLTINTAAIGGVTELLTKPNS